MKINTAAKSQKGASLIELILYTALLSIVLLVATDLLMKSGEFSLEASAKNNLLADARFINNRLSYDIHRANSITTPTTIGETTSVLSLTVGSETHTYTLVGTNLEYENDTGASVITSTINSNLTKINSMSFQRLGNSGGKHTIKVIFEIEDVKKKKGNPEKKTYEIVVGVR